MTTDKNNFCNLGATAPSFQNAARLRGEEKEDHLDSRGNTLGFPAREE